MKQTLLFLILSISLLARADIFLEFKGSSNEIVDRLRAQGIRQIGDLNLDKLSQEIAATNWAVERNVFLLGSGKDRTTSIYLVSENKVIVNEPSLKLLPKTIFPQTSLHEAFGANGYDDENSQMSLSLEMLSKNPKVGKKIFEEQFKNLKPRKTGNEVYNSTGGGTSVGGGGDGTTIEFRTLLMEMLLESPEHVTDEKIRDILRAEIEPDWTQDPRQPLHMGKSALGIFKITLPSFAWVLIGDFPYPTETYKTTLVKSVLGHIVGSK